VSSDPGSESDGGLGFGSRSRRRSRPSGPSPKIGVLNSAGTWACVKGCGACCYLEPEERDSVGDWLEPEELTLYTSMIGKDGWCKHYDKDNRACKTYETRPTFCRVSPNTIGQRANRVYDVPLDEMESFCVSCCRNMISVVYGEGSTEWRRYQSTVQNLRKGGQAQVVSPFD
jgi:Fe-S-cluster containining protein